MNLRGRTLPVWIGLATACGAAPAAPSPSAQPTAAPLSTPAGNEPYRRKVVVIKDEGTTGDSPLVESGAVAAASAPASGPPATNDAQPASASCVQASAYAQYRSGYDHIVLLHNTCAKAADCQVSTDVNPTPNRVTVAPGATESVLTFRGSPASAFKPIVNCRVAP